MIGFIVLMIFGIPALMMLTALHLDSAAVNEPKHSPHSDKA